MSSHGTYRPPESRLPGVLQTAWWVFRPVSYMNYMRRRFGGSFRPKFIALPAKSTMVSDPSDIRAVFTAKPGTLDAGRANIVLAPLVGDNSVLVLDGERHMRQRKLLLPPFHGERLRAYVDEMRAVAGRAVDRWRVGEEIVTRDVTQQITLEVIMRVVFGVHDPARVELFRERFNIIDPSRTFRLLAFLPLERFARKAVRKRYDAFLAGRAKLDALIMEEVARRRADPRADEYDDILSLLLQARDEDGQAMTDDELRDELVTLVVAGHETTASSLAWTIELLLRHPEMLARAREEALAGDASEYIDAVIKESLRLRPIVPLVARVIVEPLELDGRTLPVGTAVTPNIWMTHHDPAIYPQPNAFRPERFLDERQPDTYSWLPFGGGIRRCIGASFALIEMRVVLQEILARATLRPVLSRPERVARRAITFVPAKGVPIVPLAIEPARVPAPATT